MDYVRAVQELRSIRTSSIEEIAERVESLVEMLLDSEHRLREEMDAFHSSQRTFRITSWYQLDWVIPQAHTTAVALQGPYLSTCEKDGAKVRKKRLSDPSTLKAVIGKGLAQRISAHREAAVKLGQMAADLDLRASVDRDQVRKSKRMAAFTEERDRRLRRLPATIRSFGEALQQIDRSIDDAILDFNAIEGKKRRYGSLLARWEVPSNLPQKTLSGPAGPGVFYIAFNRGQRMSAPIVGLYKRVHQRSPKGETPLTRQMIQKSRLGKFTADYRSAYKNLGLLRVQRNDIIEKLRDIQKRVR